MKTALLLLLFCLAQADDIRWEVKDMFQRFKSQLEGQHADMASRLEELVEELQKHKAANNNLTLEMTQLKTDLTLEITQLKSEVNKLKCKTEGEIHPCPGWTKFGDSCYYISTEWKTWQQSREYCQSQEGADLVVINSREEQDFVVRLVGRDKFVWIGLTDRETEGVFKWVDGTPLTTPTYWGTGEPNGDHGGEDCALFYNGEYYAGWRMDKGGWNDERCWFKHNWICEIVMHRELERA